MIRTLIPAAMAILLLAACNNSPYSFRELSSFRIDSTALADNERIEVTYVSGGPDYNRENEYFYHYIVVSQVDGDTVNLLTPFLAPNISGTNREFSFIPWNSISGKVLMNSIVSSREGDASQPANVNSMEQPRINKVVVNSKFKDVEENKYPVILGFLGLVGAYN